MVEAVAADIHSYFPQEYASEMIGVAPALGLKLGDVVLMNLIYEVENLGINCSTSNNTVAFLQDPINHTLAIHLAHHHLQTTVCIIKHQTSTAALADENYVLFQLTESAHPRLVLFYIISVGTRPKLPEALPGPLYVDRGA